MEIKVRIIKNDILKFLLIAFLITICHSSFSHGLEQAMWSNLNSSRNKNLFGNYYFQSIDINTTLILFNGGISYKDFPSSKLNKGNIYLGLGFGPLYQFQAGFSGNGFSTRHRSDIMLGMIFREYARKHPVFAYTTFTFTADRYYKNSNLKWVLGLGIGVSINNVFGFSYYKDFES